jgi:hypothetical protein
MVSRKQARNASIGAGIIVGLSAWLIVTFITQDPLMVGLLVAVSTGINAYIGMDPK